MTAIIIGYCFCSRIIRAVEEVGEGGGWRREMTHFNLFWNKQVITSEKDHAALAGVAQWIERQPANQKVPGSIPSQGTCLGCGPGPQLGTLER